MDGDRLDDVDEGEKVRVAVGIVHRDEGRIAERLQVAGVARPPRRVVHRRRVDGVAAVESWRLDLPFPELDAGLVLEGDGRLEAVRLLESYGKGPSDYGRGSHRRLLLIS